MLKTKNNWKWCLPNQEIFCDYKDDRIKPFSIEDQLKMKLYQGVGDSKTDVLIRGELLCQKTLVVIKKFIDKFLQLSLYSKTKI